ncbi:SPFH domain-containing protein [Aeromicrobium sp. CF3.5]
MFFESPGGIALTIVLALLALMAIVAVSMTVKIIPQAFAGVVERFGKYRTTLTAGLNIVTPFIDRVAYRIDMREQVVSFPPQPVITEENLTVSIDTVIYFQVTDPVAATYEIANYIQAIEQLTMTTLRNIIGGMTLEHALTSRTQINSGLRGELDSATGKWGIRVNRVELKGIDPPPSINDAMEKQMRADRDKRAIILTAEGDRQSAILTAEGQKQAAILNAEGNRQAQILGAQGDRQAQILRAQGEAQAIGAVFQAIHDGNPDQKLLSYQYLQMLPKIAEGDNATTWIIPAELTQALGTLGGTVGSIPVDGGGNKNRVDLDESVVDDVTDGPETSKAVQEAIDAARQAERPGASSGGPVLPSSGGSAQTPPPEGDQGPS